MAVQLGRILISSICFVLFLTTDKEYPGYLEVKGISVRIYALKYQDPDGTAHPIGPLVLP